MDEEYIESKRQEAKMCMLKDGIVLPKFYLEKRDKGIVELTILDNNYTSVVLMLQGEARSYKSYLHICEYPNPQKKAISIVYKEEFSDGFDEIIPFIQTPRKVYFDTPIHNKTTANLLTLKGGKY